MEITITTNDVHGYLSDGGIRTNGKINTELLAKIYNSMFYCMIADGSCSSYAPPFCTPETELMSNINDLLNESSNDLKFSILINKYGKLSKIKLIILD